MKKLKDYIPLMRLLPVSEHAVTIKKKNWERVFKFNENIEPLFMGGEKIIISRSDIFSTNNSNEKILKTLMWGYPTARIGNADTINKILKKESMIKIERHLEHKSITNPCVDGVGLSTFSKWLYFFKAEHKGIPCIVLDSVVTNAIISGGFKEFEGFIIKEYSDIEEYPVILEKIWNVARDVGLEEKEMGMLEHFLFLFGNNLKK